MAVYLGFRFVRSIVSADVSIARVNIALVVSRKILLDEYFNKPNELGVFLRIATTTLRRPS